MTAVPVPRTLDNPPRFLWWDADYVFVFATGLAMGLILSGLFLAVVTASILTWAWSRARSGGGVGRAFALIYWYLPLDAFSRVPASARRHFIG